MELPTLLTGNRREPTPPADDATKDAAEDSLSTNLLGRAAKSLVKRFDTKALGVKVELGELHIDAMSGKIAVDNVLVRNPSGYYSEYLLRAGKMIVDVDLKVLMTSMGKTVEVEEVDLQDVDVIYETGLTTSNVDDVQKKLNKLKPAGTKKASASESNDPELILHKVAIHNFGAKATSSFTRGMGPRFVMSDVVYQDFEKEMNPGHHPDDAFAVILQSLLFTAMGTCTAHKASSRFSKSLSSMATTASDTSASMKQGLSSMASSVSTRFSSMTASSGSATASGFAESAQAGANSAWEWLASCQVCEQPATGNELVVDQMTASGSGEQGDEGAVGSAAKV